MSISPNQYNAFISAVNGEDYIRDDLDKCLTNIRSGIGFDERCKSIFVPANVTELRQNKEYSLNLIRSRILADNAAYKTFCDTFYENVKLNEPENLIQSRNKAITIQYNRTVDEYRVPGPKGKEETGAYYTDIREDAIGTAKAMYGGNINVKIKRVKDYSKGMER